MRPSYTHWQNAFHWQNLTLHPWRGIRPIFKKVVKTELDGWLPELLSTVAIPLSFYLAFGLGLSDYLSRVDGVSYMVFITPGLIAMTILLEAYRTGAWGLWLSRRHTKMIDEFRIKPISTSDIIVGEILGGFAVALVKGAIVACILYLISPYETTLSNLGWFLLMMFPGCILFTCLGSLVGTTFPKPDHIAQSQTIVITPLLYLGGLFFPITAFPEWILPIVRWIPTTALFDGSRNAFLNGTVDSFYLSWLGLLAISSFIVAVIWFNQALAE